MFSLVATVLFYFKSAYLFERVAERERETNIYYLLVYCPNGHNSWAVSGQVQGPGTSFGSPTW